MYQLPSNNIKSLKDFTLHTLELEINRYCNFNCKYCYIDKSDRKNLYTADYWNDVHNMLENINVADHLTIGFCTGELFTPYTLPELKNAIRQTRKITRYKDTEISYRFYSNGSYPEEIVNFLDGLDETYTMNISFDGFNGDRTPIHDSDLRLLAKSKHTDNMVIRVAVGDYNFDSVLIDLDRRYGFKNIEYYYLHDYPSGIYINPDRFERIVGYFKDKSSLYNIEKYLYRTNPVPACDIYRTLAIDMNGNIGVCGPSINPSMRLKCRIPLCKYNRIPALFKKFEEIQYNRNNGVCNTCSNQLCEECCSYIATCKVDKVKDREFQQCKLRHAEKRIYDKIFKGNK